MEMSEEGIKKFQELFRKNYNKELSYKEAKEAGTLLVEFFDALIKADKKQNPELYKKKNSN